MAIEALILAIGAKTCCIGAAGIGGATNVLTQKKFTLGGLKDVGLAIIVGWIAACRSMGPCNSLFDWILWN